MYGLSNSWLVGLGYSSWYISNILYSSIVCLAIDKRVAWPVHCSHCKWFDIINGISGSRERLTSMLKVAFLLGERTAPRFLEVLQV